MKMNTYLRQRNIYQEVAIQTSSPVQLVVLLYEGAIRFLRESINGIQEKNIDRKRQSIDRAMAVIQHLQSTLDRDRGGDLAVELDRLYVYITSRIMEGSVKLAVAPLEEAIKLLTVLLSGWEEVARKEQEQVVPGELLAQQAAKGGFDLHV
jgi:flagellar protein FliS